MRTKLIGVVVCVLSLCAAVSAESPVVHGQWPEYNLNIDLQPESHLMVVKGTVRLPAADIAAQSVNVLLAGQMRDFKVSLIGKRNRAEVLDVAKRETANNRTSYTIALSRAVPAREPVELGFSYKGGEKTSFVFYLGPEGSFAGGSNTAWYPQFSKEKIRGIGTMTFTVPEGYTVIASGEPQPSAGPREFKFKVSVPEQLSFAAAKYQVVRTEGPAPVTAYLFRTRPGIEKDLEKCQRVLAGLAEIFGSNPYGRFSIAEVPSEQSGNAGFSGASFEQLILVDTLSLNAPFNLAFYAHELSHLWWGNMITRKGDKGDYMLDEAMAQYGSLTMVNAIEGPAMAERYRRTGYPGYANMQNGHGFLLYVGAGLDEHPMDSLPSSGISHELADAKGFLVIDLLSRTIGRERFHHTLAEFTAKHAFEPVTWDEFLASIQAGSAQDVSWFYQQWLERTGAPDWQLQWSQQNGKVSGSITQSAPFYRASLEVAAYCDDGEHALTTVEVNGAKTEFAFAASFKVKDVKLDPQFKVLHWTPEYREEAAALAPILRAQAYRMTGKNDDARKALDTALATLPVPDKYGVGCAAEAALAQVYMGEQKWTDAKTHLIAALERPTRRAESLPWIYYVLAVVAKHLNDDSLLRTAVEGAAGADSALDAPTGAAQAARALISAANAK